ncbi:MAG: GGDEF domain-containing response regulator [Verrucomicrobium sp.]|nr:GGDEF domain-containing response regulator [Verrucomicrobium sp.]
MTADPLAPEGVLRILLVEDNPGDLLLLKETLAETRLPFALTHCADLESALALSQTDLFELMLLDLSLPDSTGVATVARASQAYRRIPIIVMTSLDDDAVGLKAIQLGAQDYLVKQHVTAYLLRRSVRYARERHRERQVLLKASLIDDMTGLYNRRGFLSAAHEELERGGGRFLALFADLDGLKQINDLHGHAWGDRAIVKTAEILKLCLDSEAVAARLGGDEFVALIPSPRPGAEEALRASLQKEVDGVNRKGEKPFPLSVSIGFQRADLEEGPIDLETLLARADGELYKAKRVRKGV